MISKFLRWCNSTGAVFDVSPVRRELDEIALQKLAEREKQVEDGALPLP